MPAPAHQPLPPPLAASRPLCRDSPQGGGGGGALLAVPSHSKHQTFSDVPLLIERSALVRGILAVMGFKPQPISAQAALRVVCDCAARFCREHTGSDWPCEGAGGDEGGEAAAVAAECAGDAEGAGAALRDGLAGFATDEAAEAESEAAARVAVAAPPPPRHHPDTAPHPTAARPLPVRAEEAGAGSFYGRLKDEGLLRILEAYE
jgi:hypothetical protein